MQDAVRQVTESRLFERYGTIDERIDPILFLASSEASYVTGSLLRVAGSDLG